MGGSTLNEKSFANSDFENGKHSGTIKVEKANDAEVKNADYIDAMNQQSSKHNSRYDLHEEEIKDANFLFQTQKSGQGSGAINADLEIPLMNLSSQELL